MTKRQMPSAAQRRVLEAMACGERVEHTTMGGVWLRGNGTFTPVPFRTWQAIWHAGWATRTEGKAMRRHYVISALGRDAIAQADTRAAG